MTVSPTSTRQSRASARWCATGTHPRAWLRALVAGEGYVRAARSGAGRSRRVCRPSAASTCEQSRAMRVLGSQLLTPRPRS